MIRLLFSFFLLISAAHGQRTVREVALTFDDLPKAPGVSAQPGQIDQIRESTARLLAAVRKHHAPAVAFVNEIRVQVKGEEPARKSLLQMWLDAGIPLGNHTFSHVNINRASLADYEADVERGDLITRPLMKAKGWDEHYFRHPFLFTGSTKDVKDGMAAYLAQHHWTVAPVTIDAVDWYFDQVYVPAREHGDQELLERLHQAYIEHSLKMFDYFENLSAQLFGRNIRHVWLLHANDINADHLDELSTALEKRGYRFITLDRALQDPAYQSKDDYMGRMGISLLHRWKLAKGMPLNYESEPDPPKWVMELNKGSK